MYELPDQPAKDIKADSATYGLPRVVLFDEKRWHYIQNRYHMTPREVQVAKLICQGLDNERIARNLRIKPGTIKTHLRNIYRRVRVKSKLTMLLMFLHDVNNSSAKSATLSEAISITEVEKSA